MTRSASASELTATARSTSLVNRGSAQTETASPPNKAAGTFMSSRCCSTCRSASWSSTSESGPSAGRGRLPSLRKSHRDAPAARPRVDARVPRRSRLRAACAAVLVSERRHFRAGQTRCAAGRRAAQVAQRPDLASVRAVAQMPSRPQSADTIPQPISFIAGGVARGQTGDSGPARDPSRRLGDSLQLRCGRLEKHRLGAPVRRVSVQAVRF
jgi:hypothetical protein